MHAFELPVFRNFRQVFEVGVWLLYIGAINYMALQISHQVYLSLLRVFKERKKIEIWKR
jgi:hypothetical protein